MSSSAEAAAKMDPAAEKAKKEELTGVFVVHGGKAAFRKVETGIAGATDIEITSGLQQGVYAFQAKFKPGGTVWKNYKQS